MGVKVGKVIHGSEVRWMFNCPGCYCAHGPVEGRWTFNHDLEKPTFSPSILVRWTKTKMSAEPVDMVCHSFVREGRIQFLSDCTHALAGQTVDLPDWEDS
jgi:hypothetical protein